MFCRNCGAQLPQGANFCVTCGAATQSAPQYTAQPTVNTAQAQAQQPTQTKGNSIAIVGFVLSFFVPLAGLICSIIGLVKASSGAGHKGLAIAGIVISGISVVLQFIFLILPLIRFLVERLLQFLVILPLLIIFGALA